MEWTQQKGIKKDVWAHEVQAGGLLRDVMKGNVFTRLIEKEKNIAKQVCHSWNGLVTYNTLKAKTSADFDNACDAISVQKLGNITALELQFVPNQEQLQRLPNLINLK